MNTTTLPNLRHLSIALHISNNYGFSAASKIVNLSPSAITQAMRGLEGALGAQIFDRSPSGAFPNELGNIYLDRIRRAFDALSQAESALDASTRKVEIKARITISQLRAFIMVCQSGSYSLAARRLGLSQPSVYKSARSIEIEFDRKLFRPSSAGVDPTPKAREFARYASIALSEIERAQEEVQEHQGKMAGRLAIGTLPLIRTRVLPASITALLAAYPDAKIQIFDGVYSDLLDSLRHGELDFMIGALRDPLPVKDIVQEPLFNDDLSILVRANHPILKIKTPSLKHLSDLNWIVPRSGTPTRTYFDQMFESVQQERALRLVECSSLVAIRAMLLNSDRATILSSHQAGYEIDKGDLCIVKFKLNGSTRPIGVTTRHNWRPTGLQAEFLEKIRIEAGHL